MLDAAVEAGVTFFDTADVYGDGRSEQTIGAFLAGPPGPGITVATKMGRRVDQEPENYNLDNFRAWTDRSRRNLGVDTLDLVQLHCPPTAGVLQRRGLRRAGHPGRGGRIARLRRERGDLRGGARPRSPARTSPACRSSSTPSGSSRWRRCCPPPQEAGVGIIARVPLASGLLSGKYTEDTSFAETTTATYNRHGEAFDVGETFSGVDYDDRRRRPPREFAALAPEGDDHGPAALRWIVEQPGVSTVIPGARNARPGPGQRRGGAAPAAAGDATLDAVRDLYDRRIRPRCTHRW